MKRRDFIKLLGTAGGGAIISSIGGIPTRAQSYNSTIGNNKIFLPFVSNGVSRPFTIYATPSYAVEIFDHESSNLSFASGDLFTPMINAIQTFGIERFCSESLCVNKTEATKDEAYANLALNNIVESVPAPLIPLFNHPINTIGRIEDGYAIEGDLILKPDPGGVLNEIECLPLEYQNSASFSNIGLAAEMKGSISNYFWRLSLEKHYIGGCIKRDVWHGGALLKYKPNDRMIFDMHLCGWWEGWTPCFGVYESRSGFCIRQCTWNVWAVLFSLAFAAGITYFPAAAAWIVNALAAHFATGTLALLTAAPGAPPPP
ncbi:hypothetical protein [Candidatus Chloroploca sp. Khr17]|uniref:hypothetical protein n=1 Tax=Candidatus Chloroploca sp. Khr17 TaxID=2496869 RepID=UPI00101BE22A|nr:hypothetical protein [Candidatus Chloroploca sp. Khr17]